MKRINGNLYLVDINEIKFADEFEDSTDFQNPRKIIENEIPKGFSIAEMTELRDSIRKNGLKHPFIGRKIGDKIQLITGERRKRCLDKLLEENAVCLDQSDNKFKSAQEIYSFVECRIENIDDIQAFSEAFSENENSISIGEARTIFIIDKFRKLGYTDEQILKITNKSPVWLRDTDKLINLDEYCLNALKEEIINRDAALELIKIQDIEERKRILDESTKILNSKKVLHVSKVNKLSKEVLKEETRLENIKTDVFNELPGSSEKLEIQSNIVKETTANLDSLIEECPIKITTKDISHAKAKLKKDKEVNADTKEEPILLNQKEQIESKGLSLSKIKKYWLEAIEDVLLANVNKDGINIKDLILVKSLIEGMENGERDVIYLLEQHYQKNYQED